LAKMTFKGLDEYERQMLKLLKISEDCIRRAVYEGAGVVADAVRQNIESIPIDNRVSRKGEMLTGITEEQKDGLREGFGISSMLNEKGYVNVKIGFDGYNSMETNSYPAGQPNSIIARSVNSGTSFRQRIPFVDSAVSAKRAECEQKMQEVFDKVLKESL